MCYYILKDNKVYIKIYGEYVGFRIFMDVILFFLIRKVKMLDMEFFVNLGDWFLEKKKFNVNIYLIFFWCGFIDFKDIVMFIYDLIDFVLEIMGWWERS